MSLGLLKDFYFFFLHWINNCIDSRESKVKHIVPHFPCLILTSQLIRF